MSVSGRGQPVIALLAMLAGWIAIRVATIAWSASTELTPQRGQAPARGAPSAGTGGAIRPRPASVGIVPKIAGRAGPPLRRQLAAHALQVVTRSVPDLPQVAGTAAELMPSVAVTLPLGDQKVAVRQADPTPGGGAAAPSRWSADAWLLARQDGGAQGVAPVAIYGASQAGGVLRYRLGLGQGGRVTAYLRVTGALTLPERELSGGLSIRPGVLPVTLYAEGRATVMIAGPRLRPGVGMIVAPRPWRLATGLIGDAYAQTGWVGGPGSTGFIEGQAHVVRALRSGGRMGIAGGAGVWGAVQQGARRLDIGPQISLALPLSDRTAARLELDWRLRVAGNAAPGSGPAVVLAASF